MITRIFLALLVIFGLEARVLILIIASDDQPIYRELQSVWRSYMHNYRDEVEAYFIKGDPNLCASFKIEGDMIWVRQEESLAPGILNKTLTAFEAMLPRICAFDHILRTNLSSFYVLPRLVEKLRQLPRKRCYCAMPVGTDGIYQRIGSGAGFILSPDVLALCVQHKEHLWDRETLDDLTLGLFLGRQGIPLLPLPEKHRMEFFSKDEWTDNIPKEVFHFRVKHPDIEDRLEHDLYIYHKLLEKYYPK